MVGRAKLLFFLKMSQYYQVFFSYYYFPLIFAADKIFIFEKTFDLLKGIHRLCV